NKIKIYRRDYLKLQNVAAEVGGFLKAIMIVIQICLYPLSKKQFNVTLLNQIFYFHQTAKEVDELEGKNELKKLYLKRLTSPEIDCFIKPKIINKLDNLSSSCSRNNEKSDQMSGKT